MYMMPAPMDPQIANTSSSRTVDGKNKNLPNQTQLHAFAGSQPMYMMTYPEVHAEQNHYSVNEPQGNNLKIDSIANLPDGDEVPVFEVDLKNVDKYKAEQKFN